MSFIAIRGCPVAKRGFVQFSGSFAIKKPPLLAAGKLFVKENFVCNFIDDTFDRPEKK